MKNHFHVVQFLVEAGAALDLVDDQRNTALMTALELGHEDLAVYLINKGANLIVQSRNDENILHKCAKGGRSSVLKTVLLKLGTSNTLVYFWLLNECNVSGKTPVRVAIDSNWFEGVQIFLSLTRADLSLADKMGFLPLNVALRNGQENIGGLIMTGTDCDLTQFDPEGQSAFYRAICLYSAYRQFWERVVEYENLWHPHVWLQAQRVRKLNHKGKTVVTYDTVRQLCARLPKCENMYENFLKRGPFAQPLNFSKRLNFRWIKFRAKVGIFFGVVQNPAPPKSKKDHKSLTALRTSLISNLGALE